MSDFLLNLSTYNGLDIALLVLRLALAAIFLVHGTRKLSGKMGGFMTFIGVCETLGGIALLVGFLTPLAALGIGIIMLGALYKKIVEWHVPFTASDKTGWEFDLLILAACVVLLVVDERGYSIDAMMTGFY